MTNEELERAIDFLVRQQGQFFTDLEEMKNQQAHTQKHIDHIMSLMTTLIERTLSNADAIEKNSELIQKNSEAIDRLTLRVDDLSVHVRDLTTDVKELTAIVKNHVSDKDIHRNGS